MTFLDMVTGSTFSIIGYATMGVVVIESLVLTRHADRTARALLREARAVAAPDGDTRRSSLLASTVRVRAAPGQAPDPTAIKAAYDRSVRKAIRSIRSWLEFVEQAGPALGLLFTMAGFTISLLTRDNPGQIVSTLGVAAGTSGLGAIAMLVAMAGRTRLEHAVETVDDAAGDVISGAGETRWD